MNCNMKSASSLNQSASYAQAVFGAQLVGKNVKFEGTNY